MNERRPDIRLFFILYVDNITAAYAVASGKWKMVEKKIKLIARVVGVSSFFFMMFYLPFFLKSVFFVRKSAS